MTEIADRWTGVGIPSNSHFLQALYSRPAERLIVHTQQTHGDGLATCAIFTRTLSDVMLLPIPAVETYASAPLTSTLPFPGRLRDFI
jgi:hypothetical protein